MTTVLGYGRDARVYFAADTSTNVFDRRVGGVEKIVRFAVGSSIETYETALFAAAGDGGLLGVIRRLPALEAVPANADRTVLDRWAQGIAETITREALDLSLTDDGRMGGTVLLGFRGRVWTITHALAIAHPDGIAAIGSGEGNAVGALDAFLVLYRSLEDEPVDGFFAEMVRTSVSLAAARDRYSDLPIQVETA